MHFSLFNLNGSTAANRPYPTCAFVGSRDWSFGGRPAIEEALQQKSILAPVELGP